MRTSDRTNSTPANPVHTGRPRGRRKKHIKRSQRARLLTRSLALSLSPAVSLSSLHVFWVSMASCLKDVFSFYFLNKTEL